MYDCLKRIKELPHGYGDHKVVLMVRDPWTIYAYWEIRSSIEAALRETIERKGLAAVKTVLRVYDVTYGEEAPNVLSDIDLNEHAISWYINHIDPGRSWMVDIGILCSNDEFLTLVRSNVVKTPANKMSEICSDEWMCPEDLYYKMFAAAGGYDIGQSSMELKELVERHLREWRSSGNVSSKITSGVSLIMCGGKKQTW